MFEAASDYEREAVGAAKAELLARIAKAGAKGIAVGIGIGADNHYRLEVRLFKRYSKNFEIPKTVSGFAVNVVRSPIPKAQVGHDDAGASSVEKLLGQLESVIGSRTRLAMGLRALVTEAREVTSLDEAKKGKPGAPDKGNPKRKALIKKLKKNKSVRDPEALATWLGLRVASMHGGLKAAKRKKKSKKKGK